MKKTITNLRKSLLLPASLLLFALHAIGSGDGLKNLNDKKIIGTKAVTYEGFEMTKEGAWCWFADPRSLHYENTGGTINSTYIGYIDVHGNIKATQQNFLTGKNNEVLIRSYFQPDDHDSPSFLVLPDERIMILYSRHTDEPCFYYRISKKPGDITALGEEKKIVTANNTTYPSPFILSDDPAHFYLCWRGINWHPTIAKLDIPDVHDNTNIVWGPYQMVQSTAARPYCKYSSNGKDKIYLTYTLGHPDNENPNWVYFNYVDINSLQLKDISGNVLSTIANGVHNISATTAYLTAHPNAVVDNPSLRDWVWQTTLDKDGLPVIALVQISADKTVHNYYYAKWTGTSWRKTFLANGGGHFHQTPGLELCYSGGMALDDSHPEIVYCSVPVSGTSGTVYEIMKYTMATDGTIASTEQITFNSTLNNVRPFIVSNSVHTALRLTWMHGNYYDWIVSSSQPKGFSTAVHCDYVLPADSINLANGLLVNENFSGTVTGTAHTSFGALVSTKDTYATLGAQSSPAFSVSLSPYIYEGAYSGTIFQMGNLTYGLDGSTLKPYITIGNATYTSNNLLGTSDVWQTEARGTGGVWWTPTKLKYFNLTISYENDELKIYRNGLIDQVIAAPGLTLSDVKIGGFVGWVKDSRIYNRALTQGEVKQLSDITLSYTLNANLLTGIELEALTIPSFISTDVVLPSLTASGIPITWSSDHTGVISNTGLVTLPQSETQVQLTATINAASKTFYETVYPRDISKNKRIEYRFDASDRYSANGLSYLQDKSGNGNDAIIYGSANVNGTLDLTANTAAGFSTNGYATAPNGIINNLRSCTFLAKLNPAGLSGAPRIFDFGSASSNSIFLRTNVFTAGYKYNGGSTILINSSTNLTAGQEVKVAMTYDAKTKTTKIYLNGVQTATSTAITYEPCQLTNIGADTRNYIGRTQWWDSSVASSNIDFNGTIDDFFLYDIALTPAEIAQVQSNQNTGLNTLEQTAFSIYPNPAGKNTGFTINSGIATSELIHSKLEIINSLGQKVQETYPTTSSILVNGLISSGIYLVRLTLSTNKIYTAKLMLD
ncbi:MAG: BNR-4 repeat-containing protein [Paludibacter sp.]|nr:BNR-4 repeat-containing protein [Paludibacter sp.]